MISMESTYPATNLDLLWSGMILLEPNLHPEPMKYHLSQGMTYPTDPETSRQILRTFKVVHMSKEILIEK